MKSVEIAPNQFIVTVKVDSTDGNIHITLDNPYGEDCDHEAYDALRQLMDVIPTASSLPLKAVKNMTHE